MEIKKKQAIDSNGRLRSTSIWQIEVDHSDIDDLELLSNKIKSQLGYLRSESNTSRNEMKRIRFDACSEIYNTDISDLYQDLVLDNTTDYYVYAHCEPRKIAIGKDGVSTWIGTFGLDLLPFYIGKGRGNRAYELDRNETHRKVRQRLKAFGKDAEVRIIKSGLTELEALCFESKLIDIFGLMGKGGKLVNLDEGVKSKERQSRYNNHLKVLNNYYKNSLMVEA
jgi:hypothetical protein